MRFGRAATQISETVSGLEPEARETMESIRRAADTLSIAVVMVSVVLIVAIVYVSAVDE